MPSCAETRRGSKVMAIVLTKSRNAVSAQLVRNPLIFMLTRSGRGESAE